MTHTNSTLKIFHWNCNGLASKIKQLEQYLHTNKPDIISLNELKCNDLTANLLLQNTNYNYTFKVRDNNKGGGVALLIRKGIDYRIIDQNECDEIVGITVKIALNGSSFKPTSIFSYYNRPNNKLNEIWFKNITKEGNSNIILGDLNAKLNNDVCEAGKSLTNILIDTNLIIANVNDEPTFTRFNSKKNKIISSKLDYILISPDIHNLDPQCYAFRNDLLQSDHHPISLDINNNLTQTDSESISFHNYKKANWDEFRAVLDQLNVDDFKNLNCSEMFNALINQMQYAKKVAVPYSSIRPNRKGPPLPNPIIDLIKIKNKYGEIYHKTGRHEDMVTYYSYVGQVNSSVEKHCDKNGWIQ